MKAMTEAHALAALKAPKEETPSIHDAAVARDIIRKAYVKRIITREQYLKGDLYLCRAMALGVIAEAAVATATRVKTVIP